VGLFGKSKKEKPQESLLDLMIAAFGRMTATISDSAQLAQCRTDFETLITTLKRIQQGVGGVHQYMVEKRLMPETSISIEEYLAQHPEVRHPVYENESKYIAECIDKQSQNDPKGLAAAFARDQSYTDAIDSVVNRTAQFMRSYKGIIADNIGYQERLAFEDKLRQEIATVGFIIGKEKELNTIVGGRRK